MKIVRAAAVAAALAISAGAPADATPARALTEGRYVLAPFSFSRFCLDYPADCRSDGPARVQLTAQRMAELTATNRHVNAAIAPQRDASKRRFWALDATTGDCNDYAVQKRHDLMGLGWPAGALSLAVVKTLTGEGHLVLTARTDAGDLVLDNLRANVVSWGRAGYRWVSRQSASNPQFWASLDGRQAPALPEH